jgi:hypothetical protein
MNPEIVKLHHFPFRGTAIVLLALTAFAFGGRLDETIPSQTGSQAPTTAPADSEPEAATETEAETTLPEDMFPVTDPADGSDPELSTSEGAATAPRKWKLSTSFSINAFYDNNILISPTDKESDEIIRATADFGITWGDYLRKEDSFVTVRYSPSGLLFMDHSEYDGFEQTGSFISQWRISKFLLGLEIGLETLTGGDVDVGTRANRTLYDIGIKLKYEYTDKTNFEANFYRDAIDYQGSFLSSVEWINRDWANFQVMPKTQIGVGLTLGDLIAQDSEAQTYEQILGRVVVGAARKLTLSAGGGWEFRQLGGADGEQDRPVFNVGATLFPADGTRISLEATRRTFSSALEAATNYTATMLTLSVRQRLQQRIFATFVGGYEDAKYDSISADTTISRHDRYFFARPGVSVFINQQANVELYYQFRNNASNDNTVSFQNNIFGVQATLSF